MKVEPETFNPMGGPEVVGRGRMFDDFCIDQDAGFAYLTTHRQNTIDRLSLEPSKNEGARISIAGDPFTLTLIGSYPDAGETAPANMGASRSLLPTEAQHRRRKGAAASEAREDRIVGRK